MFTSGAHRLSNQPHVFTGCCTCSRMTSKRGQIVFTLSVIGGDSLSLVVRCEQSSGCYLGIEPGQLRFRYESHGKPFLSDELGARELNMWSSFRGQL
jgi:hypothetical protein